MISYEKIEKGFLHLGIQFNKKEIETILLPFLKAFIIPKIEASNNDEFHFRDLMGVFFIMSRSSEEEKANSLYMLYDYSNNNSLSKNEIDHMLQRLLLKIDEFTGNIINENGKKMNEKYIEGNGKILVFYYFSSIISKIFKKFENIISKTTIYLLDGDFSKGLSKKEFTKKILCCRDAIKYDFLTTSGLFFIFKNIFIFMFFLYSIRHIFKSILK